MWRLQQTRVPLPGAAPSAPGAARQRDVGSGGAVPHSTAGAAARPLPRAEREGAATSPRSPLAPPAHLALDPRLAAGAGLGVAVEAAVAAALLPRQADGPQLLLLLGVDAVDAGGSQQRAAPLGGQRLQEEVVVHLHVLHVDVVVRDVLQRQAVGLLRLHRPVLGELRGRAAQSAPGPGGGSLSACPSPRPPPAPCSRPPPAPGAQQGPAARVEPPRASPPSPAGSSAEKEERLQSGESLLVPPPAVSDQGAAAPARRARAERPPRPQGALQEAEGPELLPATRRHQPAPALAAAPSPGLGPEAGGGAPRSEPAERWQQPQRQAASGLFQNPMKKNENNEAATGIHTPARQNWQRCPRAGSAPWQHPQCWLCPPATSPQIRLCPPAATPEPALPPGSTPRASSAPQQRGCLLPARSFGGGVWPTAPSPAQGDAGPVRCRGSDIKMREKGEKGIW